jgi:hypothetical protein
MSAKDFVQQTESLKFRHFLKLARALQTSWHLRIVAAQFEQRN